MKRNVYRRPQIEWRDDDIFGRIYSVVRHGVHNFGHNAGRGSYTSERSTLILSSHKSLAEAREACRLARIAAHDE